MISVIIPYRVDRGYLDEALESLDKQTYRDFEVIESQAENTGGYNMNRGIEKAKGDFICYLCEDDMLPPNSLKDRIEAIGDHDFLHCRGQMFFENGKIKPYPLTNPDVNLENMLIQNGIMGGTTMYRKEIFERFRWDESLWTGGEYDFHLRLLYNGLSLGFCDKVVYLYRRWWGQKSVGNITAEYQQERTNQINEIRCRYTQPPSSTSQ